MKEARVTVIPECSFCSNPAAYDGATRMGPWAFMCPDHFIAVGLGLGMGVGQVLRLVTNE